MVNKHNKVIIILISVLLFVLCLSILLGTTFINPFSAMDSIEKQIVYELRMPRAIAAILSGMTLAASGLLIQISLDNELADSSILGFQSGATLVALIIMLAIPDLYPLLPLFSFLGGLLVYGLIIVITRNNSNSLFLIVAGIAISAIIRSLINLVSTLFAENLQSTMSWVNGSLNTVQINDVKLMVIYSAILLTITSIIALRVDILLLDDEYLQTIGVNARKMRITVTVVAILLAAISVSFVGTISFVGLLAPHIARRVVDNRAQVLMPVTILVGGLLTLGCDFIQRIVFPIYEIPLGISMSFIGGIYLVILLIRSNNVRV